MGFSGLWLNRASLSIFLHRSVTCSYPQIIIYCYVIATIGEYGCKAIGQGTLPRYEFPKSVCTNILFTYVGKELWYYCDTFCVKHFLSTFGCIWHWHNDFLFLFINFSRISFPILLLYANVVKYKLVKQHGILLKFL